MCKALSFVPSTTRKSTRTHSRRNKTGKSAGLGLGRRRRGEGVHCYLKPSKDNEISALKIRLFVPKQVKDQPRLLALKEKHVLSGFSGC